MKSYFPGLIFLTISSTALAAQFVFSNSGPSSFRVSSTPQGIKISKVETRFFEDQISDQPRLFKVVTSTQYTTDHEGRDEVSVIEAYASMRSPFDTKLWSQKIKGSDFQLFNREFAQVTQYGCCDSPDIHRLINLSTGTLIEAALNQSIVEIEIPNSDLGQRYLAHVLDAKAPRARGGQTYVGTISYFTSRFIKGRVRIYTNHPPEWGSAISELKPYFNNQDEHRGRTLTLWSKNGSVEAASGFTGFGLRGKIVSGDREESFSISIDGDRFNRLHSLSSPGLELEFVP